MMRLLSVALSLGLLASVACHPGPKIGGGPKQPVGGTIAGIVSTGRNAPLPGRKVTAVDTATGKRYDATTGPNGGYTIQVPEGSYRLEIQLQAGETVAKQPGETKVNKSDLDPHRDFVISTGRAGLPSP
jgi:Carboxypeptidase regulatory-like domain